MRDELTWDRLPDLALTPEQFDKETQLWYQHLDIGITDGLEVRVKSDNTIWAFKEKYSDNPQLKVLKFIGVFHTNV